MITARAAAGLVALTVPLLAAASPLAHAQQPASGATEGVTRFSGDVFGGWDVSLTPDQGLVTAPGRRDVTYGGANASLNYSKTFRNVAFGTSGHASTRYSPTFVDDLTPFYGVTMSLVSAGASRWSWTVSQSVGYGRQNAATLFAGQGMTASTLAFGVPTGQVDYQLAGTDALTSTSSLNVGFGLSRRDRVQLGANASTVVNVDGDESRYLRLGGLVGYSRQLTRYTSLLAGYNHQENRPLSSESAGGARRPVSTMTLGLGYARPLPFSRETTVAVNTGLAGTPRRDGWFYTGVGSASVIRDMARTWRAQLIGLRSIQFVPAFPEPTLVNAVSASAAGGLSRRLTTSLGANYSTGQSGFVDIPTDFDAYSASAQLRYAVFRQAGLFAEYFYFLASIRSAVPELFPSGEFARHGVRLGVTFGTELLGGRR